MICRVCSLTISFFCLCIPCFAEEKNSGWIVAEKSENLDTGWLDATVSSTMVLRNTKGDESKRRLRLKFLESENGDKNILIFDYPKDIRGTALLSHSVSDGDDKQWLYLPSLRRVKRISSTNKSGPFLGSEFAYEDLLAPELEKYEYTWLKKEKCGELECEVVQRVPNFEDTGYARQIVWYDNSHYRMQKIEYYDRRDSLLKTLVYTGYQLYNNRYWRALKFEMTNHQSGKSTIVNFEQWSLGNNLKDFEFASARLSHAR